MAIRNIVIEGDPILNKVCRKVEKFDEKLFVLLNDMKETLKKADGVGLAAPQVGILRRVVIVDIGDGLIELINPEIIEQSGEQREVEGCLSCPQKWGITIRPMKVKVKAYNRYGEEFIVKGSGLKAKAFCHEIDHLNGILFTSKIIKTLEESDLKR